MCEESDKGPHKMLLNTKAERSHSRQTENESFYILKEYACLNAQNIMNQSFISPYYQFQETESMWVPTLPLCFHFLIIKF